MTMQFHQLFKIMLYLAGIAIIVLDIVFFNGNIYLGIIGGLVIFISGVRIDFLIYQKDRDPEEIAKKIKELVRKE